MHPSIQTLDHPKPIEYSKLFERNDTRLLQFQLDPLLFLSFTYFRDPSSVHRTRLIKKETRRSWSVRLDAIRSSALIVEERDISMTRRRRNLERAAPIRVSVSGSGGATQLAPVACVATCARRIMRERARACPRFRSAPAASMPVRCAPDRKSIDRADFPFLSAR